MYEQLKHASAIVPENDHGKRLDAALATLYPEFGLRARRRLWGWCRVLLDGRAAGPGVYVRAGQRIEVIQPGVEKAVSESDRWAEIHLVTASSDYAAVFKPAGIPSARVDGSDRRSAEEYLTENWAYYGEGVPPLLCNRLDTATSGLLLLAFGQENLERFRALEAEGAVKKYYYALVRGVPPATSYLDSALNMADREKTLVLHEPDPDPVRHTAVRRLAMFKRGRGNISLLEVLIRRGARHQIRAHLAEAGFPIMGDVLYGDPADAAAEDNMYLHHYRISFADFCAEAQPDWSEAAPLTPTAESEAGFQLP